ncbi:unannotated protein [freshwater metagenome]|uniref:Unannotated protein n=1 Tax=freshwater metagenome TaxID=449393 RepID=A0A6J7ENP5_9ZZZZ
MAKATATRVAEDFENLETAPRNGGTILAPMTPVMRRNPTASPVVPRIDAALTLPSTTTRVTIVRMMRPSTSSATAAPRTMRDSVDDSTPRSPKTRAVMPTLVAVSAAPRNTDVFTSRPSARPAPIPPRKGAATPSTATAKEALPTLASSLTSISSPTLRSRRITPISPSRRRASSACTRFSTDGPIRIPARISPRTAGTFTRSASSATSFAAASTMNTWNRIVPMSNPSVPSVAASSDIAACIR